MSAIDKIDRTVNGALGIDGVRRYKTRCKVIVHSHLRDKSFEIYDAVYAVDMSKAIKGPGQAVFTLTPIQNFLNLIFPNDLVNIYFDIGDGSGWVRTFFGYVDRIEENYSVSNEGKPSTYYRVVCTDFSKAFEKTEIYFNPQLGGRKDFAGYEFANTNIGGLTLMTKGVIVGGSPSEVVENIILLLMGFGTQFRLPSSYPSSEAVKRLRERRAEMIRGTLSPELNVKPGSMISQYDQWSREAENTLKLETAQYFQDHNPQSRAEALSRAYGVPAAQLEGTQPEVIKVLQSYSLNDKLSGGEGIGSSGTRSALGARNRAILDTTIAKDLSLVDVIDIFTFVERRALDGFIIGAPVWQKQGSISSILRSLSNEVMNELFFDLRALSPGEEQHSVHNDPVSGTFARVEDDISGNISDNSSRKTGVTYIPSVVMREYPFATVPGLDLSSVRLSIADEEGNTGLGYMPFGAIFSDNPNTPGRHVVNIRNLNVSDIALNKSDEVGIKHLDTAVIHEEEIKKTTVGRSDHDHYNLFEMYSDSLLGTEQKFYMKDFLPIITPIHILRNGLRVRTVTTRAARFSLQQVKNQQILGYDEPTQTDAASVKDVLNIVASEVGSPVDNSRNQVRFSRTEPKSNWNYRLKTRDGQKVWKWHHGIDITWKVDPAAPADKRSGENFQPEDPTPIEVKAIADGVVYVSAPEGVYDSYGNVVVIKHNFGISPDNFFIYSVYAHLREISVGFGKNKKSGHKGMRPLCAAPGMSGVKKGKMVPVPVKRGDTIGILGRTGTVTSRPHLHFEICRFFPGAELQGLAGLTSIQTAPADAVQADAPAKPASLVSSPFGSNIPKGQTTFDPVAFYDSFSPGLLEDLLAPESSTEEDGEQEDDRTADSGIPEDQQLSKEDEGVTDQADEDKQRANQSLSRTSVDTPSSRKQLIRWAALQDHWYQHNLEYLSGKIEMRGAPEIRVGYRLDIEERRQSYYVEAVQHSWRFPNNMNTTLMVSRGQPNNPYPAYVLPPSTGELDVPESQRRTSSSRLAKYFVTPDPIAIRRSLFIRSSGSIERDPGNASSIPKSDKYGLVNTTDIFPGAEIDEKTGVTTVTSEDKKYTEKVIVAGSQVDPEDTENAGSTVDSTKSREDTVTGPSPAATIPRGVKGN